MSKMFAALYFDYIQECFTRRILSHYNVDMLVIGRSDSRHQANGNSGMKSTLSRKIPITRQEKSYLLNK